MRFFLVLIGLLIAFLIAATTGSALLGFSCGTLIIFTIVLAP